MTNDSNRPAPIGVEAVGVQKDQDEKRLPIRTSKFLSSDSTRHTELTDIATEGFGPGDSPIPLQKQQTLKSLIPSPMKDFLDPTSPDFEIYEYWEETPAQDPVQLGGFYKVWRNVFGLGTSW